MYHSITFITGGDLNPFRHYDNEIKKNTWDDWHLIPTSRPVFDPPETKTQYVDIPGSDGVVDLAESLTGYPVYQNREGSIEFLVENGYKEWHELYSEIMDYLHGQRGRAILEDDPAHYYEGRFFVNQWKSDPHWSIITIDYNLQPYRMRIESSLDDWKWDSFNFNTGVIQSVWFKDIKVRSDTYVTRDYTSANIIGRKPICPTFIVDTVGKSLPNSKKKKSITIKLYNKELGIEVEKEFYDGSTTDPEFILSNISRANTLKLSFKGYGTVSIDFRSGGL